MSDSITVAVPETDDGFYEAHDHLEFAPAQEIETLSGSLFSYEALKPGYAELIRTMVIHPSKKAVIDTVARRILSFKDKYVRISALTATAANGHKGIPWQFIALAHLMEANGNWNSHLANGDPLRARTVHVPAGRIPDKEPPYTFTEAALDALRFAGLDTIPDFPLTRMAWVSERYNGMGYRKHGVNSPYLWAGTNHYTKGRYVLDGVYDPNSVSQQLGTMAVLQRVMALDGPLSTVQVPMSSTDLTNASRKLTLIERVKAAFIAVYGSYFSAEYLGYIPDSVRQFKALGLSFHELAILGVAIVVFLTFSIISYMTKQDQAAGRYVPSGITETPVNPDAML
jgi:lysozyme family protein